MGTLNAQIAGLNATITDLRNQVKELTAERDRLKNQDATTGAESNATVATLTTQIETLARENAAVQKSLADEISKAGQGQSQDNAALVRVFCRLAYSNF